LKAACSVSICLGLNNEVAIQNLAEIYEEFVNSKTLTVQEALESHMID